MSNYKSQLTCNPIIGNAIVGLIKPIFDAGQKGYEFNIVWRLMARSEILPSGCWIFSSVYHKSGHAVIGIEKKMGFIHRVSWNLFKGIIPENKCVLHRCIGHPNCWNPDHLYLGTKKDNAVDRKTQGRNGDHAGSKNGRAKLNQTTVSEIRAKAAFVTGTELSRQYGVSDSTISTIINNKNWVTR